MSEQRTRSEVLDEWITSQLGIMAGEVLYSAKLPSTIFQDPEPQWWEFRESVIRVLFEMDHEQTRHEIHAQYVKENCL